MGPDAGGRVHGRARGVNFDELLLYYDPRVVLALD